MVNIKVRKQIDGALGYNLNRKIKNQWNIYFLFLQLKKGSKFYFMCTLKNVKMRGKQQAGLNKYYLLMEHLLVVS